MLINSRETLRKDTGTKLRVWTRVQKLKIA